MHTPSIAPNKSSIKGIWVVKPIGHDEIYIYNATEIYIYNATEGYTLASAREPGRSKLQVEGMLSDCGIIISTGISETDGIRSVREGTIHRYSYQMNTNSLLLVPGTSRQQLHVTGLNTSC